MRARVCRHGNDPQRGLCPACANEQMARRQRAADRARFAAQLRRIKGKGRD
jgi:hypothetical protein